jgi:hypothetical protein
MCQIFLIGYMPVKARYRSVEHERSGRGVMIGG